MLPTLLHTGLQVIDDGSQYCGQRHGLRTLREAKGEQLTPAQAHKCRLSVSTEIHRE